MGTYSTGPGRGSSYGTSSSGSDNPITAIIGLGIAGVSVWAFVCAARIFLSCLSLSLDVVFGVAADSVFQNVILSAAAGAICGLVIAIMRAVPRKPGSLGKAFISALFSKGLAAPSLDGVFWTKAFIGTLVGVFVGGLTGASGALSAPQASLDSVATVISSHAFPLMALVGGGFGGPGGTGFWPLLFLALVIFLLALLVGALSGVFIHLVLYGALGGATKGTFKALVLRILIPPSAKEGSKPRPILEGFETGMLTGALVGVIEAIFTIWGVVRFYHPATMP